MNCDSTHILNGYSYGCYKRKGHKGYHKAGFVVW